MTISVNAAPDVTDTTVGTVTAGGTSSGDVHDGVELGVSQLAVLLVALDALLHHLEEVLVVHRDVRVVLPLRVAVVEGLEVLDKAAAHLRPGVEARLRGVTHELAVAHQVQLT